MKDKKRTAMDKAQEAERKSREASLATREGVPRKLVELAEKAAKQPDEAGRAAVIETADPGDREKVAEMMRAILALNRAKANFEAEPKARRQEAVETGARVVTATETAKNFGAIVDRVRETGAVHVVERGGTPVVEIGPVTAKTVTIRDFAELVRSGSIPSPGREYLEAVEQGVAFCNLPETRENRWGS